MPLNLCKHIDFNVAANLCGIVAADFLMRLRAYDEHVFVKKWAIKENSLRFRLACSSLILEDRLCEELGLSFAKRDSS